MKSARDIFKNRIFIIYAVAFVVIAAVIIMVLSIVGSPKKTPVSSDYITVTVQTDSCAMFRLSKDDNSVIKSKSLNDLDNDLVYGTASMLPFKQSAIKYLKALISAHKLGTKYSDVVLFAVESTDKNDFQKLSDQFKATLKECGSNAGVYSLYIKVKSSDIQNLADSAKVSYAKAYLCSQIANQSSKLNVNELIKMSVVDIINALVVAKPDIKDNIKNVVNDIIIDANCDQENTFVANDSDATSSMPQSNIESLTSIDTDNTSDDSSSFIVSDDSSGWLPGYY